MTRKTISSTLVLILFVFAFLASSQVHSVNAAKTIVQLKWSNPMQVYDVVVSDDGLRLAAVNNTGLHYFNANSPIPLWSYQPPTIAFRSVAISSDGDFVIAGDGNGFLHYFNNSRARSGDQPVPTWTSIDMGGAIERGTLDMSANGRYAVVGGTGVNMWYYGNCTNRAGTGSSWTWVDYVGYEFWTVHISKNGKYVAGGGIRGGNTGFVVFYENATTMEGMATKKWHAQSQLSGPIQELTLSDDGYAVAAISADIATLRYWANATGLTGDPDATWKNAGSFSCIDMNANGSSVVAGGYYLTSIHFWDGCRTRVGVQPEDWVELKTTNIYDVALNVDGTMIAAPAMNLPSDYRAYFLYSDGTIIDGYSLPQFSNMVSMSDDGKTVAMAGPGFDSLYLFKLETDSTPPAINKVWQQPDNASVQPFDSVNVFANITDDLSGVHNVIINYTTGNGTWFTGPMDLYSREIWNRTIPGFPYCTTITYVITAEDNANNTITSQDLGYVLTYHVIPEASPTAAMLMLMATTALTAIATRKRRKL